MRNNYRQNWLKILHNNCLNYKDPSLINMNKFVNKDLLALGKAKSMMSEKFGKYAHMDSLTIDDDKQIWVSVAMTSPGKHHYMIKW